MIIPSKSSDFREIVIKNLKKDMIGPNVDSLGDAIIEEKLYLEGYPPQQHYVTGFLIPNEWSNGEENPDIMEGREITTKSNSADEQGKNMINSEEEREEKEVSGRTIQSPSSMGLTFSLNDEGLKSNLIIELQWGQYKWIEEKKGNFWERSEYKFMLEKVPDEIKIGEDYKEFLNDTGIYVLIRRTKANNTDNHFTIRLVNGRPHKLGDFIEGDTPIFQTKMKVISIGFVDARWISEKDNDETTTLLYHDSKILARGHNVSVDWNEDYTEVWTDWIPRYDVRRSMENEELSNFIPTMAELSSEENINYALEKLSRIMNNYRQWAIDLEERFEGINDELHPTAKKHIKKIRENIERMERGLLIIRNSGKAKKAFILANKSIWKSQNCPAVKRDKEFKWRPFQICFILLNLSGLFSKENDSVKEDRDIIDLAWFPTGGGKTEAYLGLIACIGFYRHLHSTDNQSAVQAIMRYTLRLLTLQQGERATRLMVAMNLVSEEEDLGCHEFSVGMWIGSAATPNSNADAMKILEEIKATNTANPTGVSPIQLDKCPWCGHRDAEIKQRARLWTLNENNRIRGKCSNDECVLSTRDIPFSCVDDDLYDNPPTLLIGTVDKFARLASEPRARVLLGLRGEKYHLSPPDLVIQDELHLLTGPLGSLAGLFESAIEVLWKKAGTRVKYIAATATIRGADRNTKIMYGRDLNVFPPPGLTIKDNFFSEEREDIDGRAHIAILGNYNNSRSILNKPLANLIQVTHGLIEDHPEKINQIDPYWTPIVYFNSLRELNGARSALEDSIINEDGLIPDYADLNHNTSYRRVENIEELFSRKKAEELKLTLSKLSNKVGEEECLDICFTTNMFQVGVDVDRLGLMLINGQPKSNSEYIQIFHIMKCIAHSIKKCINTSMLQQRLHSVPMLSRELCRQ